MIEFYWTVVGVAVGAGWALVEFIRDRRSQEVEHNSEIMKRLQEVEKAIIDNPDIQKYLSKNAAREEEYFRNQTVLEEDIFYKAKAHVYCQLNLFDEILSIPSRAGGILSILMPPALTERLDWEAFIKVKLRHPLFRSILKHEIQIFGDSLQCFWRKNSKEIESMSADRFAW